MSLIVSKYKLSFLYMSQHAISNSQCDKAIEKMVWIWKTWKRFQSTSVLDLLHNIINNKITKFYVFKSKKKSPTSINLNNENTALNLQKKKHISLGVLEVTLQCFLFSTPEYENLRKQYLLNKYSIFSKHLTNSSCCCFTKFWLYCYILYIDFC